MESGQPDMQHRIYVGKGPPLPPPRPKSVVAKKAAGGGVVAPKRLVSRSGAGKAPAKAITVAAGPPKALVAPSAAKAPVRSLKITVSCGGPLASRSATPATVAGSSDGLRRDTGEETGTHPVDVDDAPRTASEAAKAAGSDAAIAKDVPQGIGRRASRFTNEVSEIMRDLASMGSRLSSLTSERLSAIGGATTGALKDLQSMSYEGVGDGDGGETGESCETGKAGDTSGRRSDGGAEQVAGASGGFAEKDDERMVDAGDSYNAGADAGKHGALKHGESGGVARKAEAAPEQRMDALKRITNKVKMINRVVGSQKQEDLPMSAYGYALKYTESNVSDQSLFQSPPRTGSYTSMQTRSATFTHEDTSVLAAEGIRSRAGVRLAAIANKYNRIREALNELEAKPPRGDRESAFLKRAPVVTALWSKQGREAIER
ncbi:uncharacterized protein BcabD6B2_09190 [Babesia caballi]|uniref:Uncharacterized protein n=1 Tax=Babesia caballi TaxID=5871 RepID=A0AAV4LSB1_BABCB|nr:hypothetical protein, conserved [Babesia caballi]